MSQAVITGVGVVSPLGAGTHALWDGLRDGVVAVGPIQSFDATTFPTRVAAEVPAAVGDLLAQRRDLAEHVAAGLLRDRKAGFALLAAEEAWRGAGLGEPGQPGRPGRPDRHGDHARDAWLSIALGLEQAFLDDFGPLRADGHVDWASEIARDHPAVRLRSPVDLAARILTQKFGLGGSVVVHVSACAAGALAVAHAASLVERGQAPLVLCGGADSMINPLGIGGMSRLGAPSPRASSDACRPFDRRRDGLAMGEGAAMFVVESEERARARGAPPIARILGWGSTQDAYKATAPLPDGSAAAEAMARAIARARLSPAELGGGNGYINAHGTGTPLNDPCEVRAIGRALGDVVAAVPTSSIKGAIGHLMAAAGAMEIAASLMAFTRDLLPGTANLADLDPACDAPVVDILGPRAREARPGVILSSSFGFGGQNACVALGRPR